MTTSNITTLYRVPQTPTSNSPKTAMEKYDAILSGIMQGVPKKDRPAFYDRFATASEALDLFLNDPAAKKCEILHELALALAKMISPKAHPHEQSAKIANTVLDMAYQNDFPSSLDWSARQKQCCATAWIMFSLAAAAQSRHAMSIRTGG